MEDKVMTECLQKF